jgi:hypothetical protein
MYRIIYMSSSVKLLEENEIDSLLKHSRRSNINYDITGVLLYIEGDFLQVIEGEEDVITNLFEKIKKDSRHKGIICLFSENVKEKQFSDWSMGFHITNYKKLIKDTGFDTLSRIELANIEDKTASILLNTFIKSHRDSITFW